MARIIDTDSGWAALTTAVLTHARASGAVDARCALVEVSALIDQLCGLRVGLLIAVGRIDRVELGGLIGSSPRIASGLLRATKRLAAVPGLSDAVSTGTVTVPAAAVITAAITPDRRDAAEADAASLIALATNCAPADLADAVRDWGRGVDTANGVDGSQRRRARRSLELHSDDDDMTRLTARLDPEAAEIVRTALDTATGELYRDEDPANRPLVWQRNADALLAICRAFLAVPAAKADGTRLQRPTVIVTVDLPSLQTGTGTGYGATGQHLSAESVRRIACDANIVRVITNGASVILDEGRSTRTVTDQQWRALIVRDRHCVIPGCNASPSRCEAHHIIHWANDGPSDLDNYALVCWEHHDAIHAGRWQLTRDPYTDHLNAHPTPPTLPRTLPLAA